MQFVIKVSNQFALHSNQTQHSHKSTFQKYFIQCLDLFFLYSNHTLNFDVFKSNTTLTQINLSSLHFDWTSWSFQSVFWFDWNSTLQPNHLLFFDFKKLNWWRRFCINFWYSQIKHNTPTNQPFKLLRMMRVYWVMWWYYWEWCDDLLQVMVVYEFLLINGDVDVLWVIPLSKWGNLAQIFWNFCDWFCGDFVDDFVYDFVDDFVYLDDFVPQQSTCLLSRWYEKERRKKIEREDWERRLSLLREDWEDWVYWEKEKRLSLLRKNVIIFLEINIGEENVKLIYDSLKSKTTLTQINSANRFIIHNVALLLIEALKKLDEQAAIVLLDWARTHCF